MTKILKAEDGWDNIDYDLTDGRFDMHNFDSKMRIDGYMVAVSHDTDEYTQFMTMLVDEKDGTEPHFVTWHLGDDEQSMVNICEWHVIDGRAILQMTDEIRQYDRWRIDRIFRWDDSDNFKGKKND